MVSRVFSINTKCQIRVCETKWSNESPSGAFKRQNGLASARWRSFTPTSSRLLNEVQQCIPQWGVQATERSCDSKMEGPRPDKFAFALATNTPAGCLSDRTFLRKQSCAPTSSRLSNQQGFSAAGWGHPALQIICMFASQYKISCRERSWPFRGFAVYAIMRYTTRPT